MYSLLGSFPMTFKQVFYKEKKKERKLPMIHISSPLHTTAKLWERVVWAHCLFPHLPLMSQPTPVWFPPSSCANTAQAKITKDPHISKSLIFNRVANLKNHLYVRLEPVLLLFAGLAVQMWASCSLSLCFPLPTRTKDGHQLHGTTPELIRGSLLLMKREMP